jgi:hypothetical protein
MSVAPAQWRRVFVVPRDWTTRVDVNATGVSTQAGRDG